MAPRRTHPPPLQRAAAILSALVQFGPEAHQGAVAHCEVARMLADRLGLGSGVQVALGQVFDRWDGRGLSRLIRGEALPPAIRMVHVARDAQIVQRLGGPDAAIAPVRERRGGAYDPRVARRYVSHARRA